MLVCLVSQVLHTKKSEAGEQCMKCVAFFLDAETEKRNVVLLSDCVLMSDFSAR